MSNRLDLPRARIAEVCRRYGLVELAVFGSAARGEQRDDSDVDFLYVVGPDAPRGWELYDLQAELAALIGRPVDLVPKEHLHWVIRDRVLAEAEIVYAA